MAKIGYARVSTDEQNLDLQIEALKAAGVVKTNIYQEKVSGVAHARTRQSLSHCLDHLKEGDQLYVWKIDRLGRSVAHLVELVDDLRARKVDLVSITEGIDTRTPAGMMVYHMIAAMAQLERDMISERVKAGMQAAKTGGRHLGRPPKIDNEKRMAARKLLESGMTTSQIAKATNLSISTIKRALSADVQAENH